MSALITASFNEAIHDGTAAEPVAVRGAVTELVVPDVALPVAGAAERGVREATVCRDAGAPDVGASFSASRNERTSFMAAPLDTHSRHTHFER